MIKIDMVSIPVSDQQIALEFYTNKLGFKVTTDETFGPGLRWIELITPNGDTKISLFTPPGQEDRIGTFSNIIFSCDDLQKTYEQFKAKGVEFTQPPKKESWGTSSLFKDPDGNVFCLSCK